MDRGWSTAQPVRLTTPVREFQQVNGAWQPMLYHTGFPVRVKVAHWPAAGRYVVRYHTVASDGRNTITTVRTSPTCRSTGSRARSASRTPVP